MPWIDEVSRFSKWGDCSTCHTIDGTPPKLVMRSRSMSSRARSGSHLYINTSLLPADVAPCSVEWQPVAWKNGTDSSCAACAGALPAPTGAGWAGGSSPSSSMIELILSIDRAPEKPSDMRLVVKLRCVPRAPLGRPVVPDV